jgi:O-antigen/teichoic acid export membrane protein
MGASSYLIQEQNITDDKIRSAWMLQIGTGIVLSAIVAAIAVPVGNFYNKPEMTNIIFLLAINFLINPIGTITIAWWMREMKFQRIAVTRFIGAVSGAGVSIYLAWHQWGPISLAIGSLTTTLASIIMTTLLRPKNLPRKPGFKDINKILSFGGKLSISTIINSAAQGAPEAVIARIQSVTDAGLLSRANGLVGIFNQIVMNAVSQIFLPLFSKNLREKKPLEKLHLKSIELITGIGWPFFAVLAITALPVTRILYGPQWDSSVAVAQILCLVAATGLLTAGAHELLLATGRLNTILWMAIIGGITKVIVSLFGAYHGLTSLAWSLFLHALVFSAIWIVLLGRCINLEYKQLARVSLKSLILAILAASPVFSINHFIGFYSININFLALLSAFSLSAITFILAAKVLKHETYNELVNLALQVRSSIQNR